LNLDDYCSELVARISTAWESAMEHIKGAQEKQKRFHDHQLRFLRYQLVIGSWSTFLRSVRKRAYKFSGPFRGPYQVQRLFPNGAEVSSLMKDKNRTIRVALNRVRRCP